MKQKTIRLPEGYFMRDGVVLWYGYQGESKPIDAEGRTYPIYGESPSDIKIGAEVLLVSRENLSPNAIREGRDKPVYSIRFAPNGIPGNSNNNIMRFHGWRGTTNNIAVYAHGLRRITNIRQLNNGQVAVTVGCDIAPERD